MPYQWTAERERLMLLLAVSSCNLKPSADTWAAVAGLLGEGLTPSAVSQKYYKLRKESVKLYNGVPILTPPSTPGKRKAAANDDEEMKHQTPTKRPKRPVKREQTLEVESSSDYSHLSSFSVYESPYVQIPFSPYGMEPISIKPQANNDFSIGLEDKMGLREEAL